MSMPMAHMVAFCSDIGIAPTQGAAMLSVLLGSAFFARQFWGWLADRIGGLRTILWASAAQATAMAGFLVTQDEIGLFTISAVFGFGFGGLIPGYVLAVRELFPASEASWRIPTMLFPGSLGMAAGGWVAGVMYDRFAFYAPAFAVGVVFNLLNLAVIGALVMRHRPHGCPRHWHEPHRLGAYLRTNPERNAMLMADLGGFLPPPLLGISAPHLET